MKKWSTTMKGIGIAVLVLMLTASFVFAAGNVYIPGSRDGEGAIGEDGKSFLYIRGTTDIIMEGATSDAYEATIRVPDPGSDIVYTMPATTGTLAISGASPVGSTLTDTKILVGNSAGTATEQSLTLTGDATGTMTNAGAVATTLAANSVSVSQAFINEVTLLVNAGATTNSVTVDSGHKLMGFYLSTIGGINGNNLVNSPYYDGSGSWVISMVNAVSADAVWTFVFLSDN
jgi:hypothetical protein